MQPHIPRCVRVDAHIIIDLYALKVYRNHQEIYLTAKEWDLLVFFLIHHGAFVSYETILNAVWGELYDRACLYKMVQKLRQKLGEQLISTVHRAGYRFVEVTELPIGWYKKQPDT